MADTKVSALTAATTLADTDSLYVVVGGVSQRLTFGQLKVLLGTEITKAVTAQQNNTTVTFAAVTQLAMGAIAAGTYRYKAEVIWQSATLTTGINLMVRATGGTVTRNVGHTYTTTTGGAATTGIADQTTVAGTFQMLESRAWRSNTADPGAHGGVDTVNSDQFSVIEGNLVITAATTALDVVFASEVAATQVSIMPGTTFMLEKVA